MSENATKYLQEIFSGEGDEPIEAETGSTGQWTGEREMIDLDNTQLEVPAGIADIPADEEPMGIMLPETEFEIQTDEIQEKIDKLNAEILKNKMDWQVMVNKLNEVLPENNEIFTLDPREIPKLLKESQSEQETQLLQEMLESSAGRNIANLLDQIDDYQLEQERLNQKIKEIKKAA